MVNLVIKPNREALDEALSLSGEILRNIELSEIPLANVALKASRLARLLNDFEYHQIMQYESSGYPTTPDGVSTEVWKLGKIANRITTERDNKTGNSTEKMTRASIAELEATVAASEIALSSARDPDISLSTANPNQHLLSPRSNRDERAEIRYALQQYSKVLAERKRLIYDYVMQRHYELRFSRVADDIFSRTRVKVDKRLGELLPDGVQRFTAAYDNLQSENPEDWSNAVHSCRRILQSLADVVYPPSEDKVVQVDGKSKTIRLGQAQYINRIMAYVEKVNSSERYRDIVGTQLAHLGERLDAVYSAANKGTHESIVDREEADRYVIYTYLLVGDLLSLESGPEDR